jgi:hypothetical protein
MTSWTIQRTTIQSSLRPGWKVGMGMGMDQL